MAEIKIKQIQVKPEKEIIDLKTEGDDKNSEAFIAFTTLRGGLSAAGKWCCVIDQA